MTQANGQWDIVSSVGLTALGVAAARAVETGRDEALVQDGFAAPFVRAAEPPVAMPTSPEEVAAGGYWSWMGDFLGVRSRFFDTHVATAGQAGLQQVVVLAAGLDARAFRLDWPAGCHLFEVDQPQVLAFKNRVLTELEARARCVRHVVDTDLRANWPEALLQAGFHPSAPTLWLAEGLLPYLPAAAEQQLFTAVTQLSAPGSRLSLEWVHDIPALLADPLFTESSQQVGIDLRGLWSSEPRMPADERLAAHGWSLQTESVADAAARYGRTLDPRAQQVIGQHGQLTRAHR